MIKRFKTSYWVYYKTITTLHHYGASVMKNDLEKKVMRKVTLRIIPFIMLLYFIAFLDRVNIGFAALTMNQDLGFSPTVFGLGAGIFFLGYFLFEVPSNLILHKVGARIWIARVMITWGFVSGCMAFVQDRKSTRLNSSH